ncbi:MAG: ABC transporter permease, partial [Proteobacteria bacterium]|nr:ABC transporter permease [Pseudomonadota bacterium]
MVAERDRLETPARPRRLTLGGQAPIVTLIVLCAATALLTDRFMSPLNLSNILVQCSVMAVIAMGMTFVVIGGGFDLSVGSVAALSGCVAAEIMIETNITLGVLAGLGASALVGLVNGLTVTRLKVNPFITTLGTMVLVRGVVFLMTAGQPITGDVGLPASFVAFGVERLLGVHYLVWVPALLLVLLSWVLHHTPYGRYVFATGGGREAAYLSGVPVDRITTSTYVVCSLLA